MVGKKMRLGDQTRDVQNNHQINSTTKRVYGTNQNSSDKLTDRQIARSMVRQGSALGSTIYQSVVCKH